MNNIKLLLPAYAKKQLSDSGGRQVVDKMFDVSLNRRIVEWSGTDRPEFTDFDGAKVCVELEEENLVTESNDLTETEWTPEGVTVSIPSETFRDLPVSLVEATDTAAGWRSVRRLDPVFAEADPNPFWEVYVKPVNNVRYVYLTSISASGTVFPNSTDRSTVFADLEQVEVVTHNVGTTAEIEKVEDGWFRIAIKRDVIVTDNANEARISVGISDGMVGGTDTTEVAYNSQSILVAFASAAINKRYSTLPIYTSGSPVTRLAPTVPVDTISTDFGVLGVVDDFVFGDEGTQRYPIVSGLGLSQFYLSTRNNNRIQIQPDGNSSVIVEGFGFQWQPANTRKTWAFILKWVEGSVELAVFNSDTNEISYNSYSTTGYASSNAYDIQLSGSQFEGSTSHRYENYMRFADLSEDTVKSQFELLLKGTSIEATADEMEIVS